MMFPSQTQDEYTALIWAIKSNYLEVVQELVAARADVNAQDSVGERGHCIRRGVLIGHCTSMNNKCEHKNEIKCVERAVI